MPTAPRRPTQEMNSYLAPLEIERRQAQEHRHRPRDQHQDQRYRHRPEQTVGQPVRPGQQAEQHEHHDLRQPGNGIEKYDDRIVRARLLVADHEAGEIDREKSRRVYAHWRRRRRPARLPPRMARAGLAPASVG